MKTIKNIFAVLTALVLLLPVSCTDELYEKGAAENVGSIGVSFKSVQPHEGMNYITEEDPTELLFPVVRTETGEEAFCFVDFECSEPEAVEQGIISVSPVVFKEGQTETSVKVKFPKTQKSVQYDCRLTISDPSAALIYGKGKLSVDFSFIRVEWEKLTGGNGAEKGYFRDGNLSQSFGQANGPLNPELQVEIYERKDKPGYFRVINPYSPELISLWSTGSVDNASKYASLCTPVDFIVDASEKISGEGDNEIFKVTVPDQFTGFAPGTLGKMYLCTLPDAEGTYDEATGIISLPEMGVSFAAVNPGNPVKIPGKTRIVLPGFAAPDYSILLAPGQSAFGNTGVQYTAGADVASIKYKFYRGRLDDGEIFVNVDNIMRGVEEGVEDYDNSPGVLPVFFFGGEGIETDFYTLVTVTVDKDGKCQESASCSFGHVAQGDDKTPVVSAELLLTNKHIAQGHTKENSMEFSVHCADAELAMIALVQSDLVRSEQDVYNYINEHAMEMMLDSKTLSVLRKQGVTGFATNLRSGTSYSLIVYISNGYAYKILRTAMTTEGVKIIDPANDYFNYSYFEPGGVSKEDLCKEWNMYAIPTMTNVTSRQMMNRITIEDTEDYTDPDGNVLDMVTVKGMWKRWGIPDRDMQFAYANGVLISLMNIWDKPLVMQDKNTGKEVTMWLMSGHWTGNQQQGPNFVDGAMLGGYVGQGYIAFCASPQALQQGFNINTILLWALKTPDYEDVSQKNSYGMIAGFTNILISDADVYDVEDPTEEGQEAGQEINYSFLEADRAGFKRPNYVQTDEQLRLSQIEAMTEEIERSNAPVITYEAAGKDRPSYGEGEFKLILNL